MNQEKNPDLVDTHNWYQSLDEHTRRHITEYFKIIVDLLENNSISDYHRHVIAHKTIVELAREVYRDGWRSGVLRELPK